MLGLWLNVERVESRMAFRVLRGFRDSSGEVGRDYFEALCDTPAEAEAYHNLHHSRCESAKREQAVPVDGGIG